MTSSNSSANKCHHDILATEIETEDEEINFSESINLLGQNTKSVQYSDLENKKSAAYPTAVYYIVGNEFCERFTYYGLRAILILYLTNELYYSEDKATVIYHIWCMLCYFMPIIGAVIADSYLGRFRTILYISIIYLLGSATLSASAVPFLVSGLRYKIALCFCGLFMIAVGTGGIKPCVSAFGGDQFTLPEQTKELAQFFSFFYFSINAGSLLSTSITPILREDVQCFERNCFSLAFGIPSLLMVISLGYKKITVGSRKKNWLDLAEDVYEKSLIQDIKRLMKVLFLFLPLPFFWALFDQQGSRWTLQASKMSGWIGSWNIKPDQLQVLNPLLILLLIPLFEKWIYPFANKYGLFTKPLKKMLIGGLLAASAFVISSVVQFKIETSMKLNVIEEHKADLSFINFIDCTCEIRISSMTQPEYALPYEQKRFENIDLNGATKKFDVSIAMKAESCGRTDFGTFVLSVSERNAYSVILYNSNGIIHILKLSSDDYLIGNEDIPRVRLIIFLDNIGLTRNSCLYFVQISKDRKFYCFLINMLKDGIFTTDFMEVDSGLYKIHKMNDDGKFEVIVDELITVKEGAVYNVIFETSNTMTKKDSLLHVYEVQELRKIHMLWLLPQYALITVGEILFSITGLEFSYAEAPENMKSFVQASWLLTVSVGNLIVVFVTEAQVFKQQSLEFLLFAVLMVLDMIAFGLLSSYYENSRNCVHSSNVDGLQITRSPSIFDDKSSIFDDKTSIFTENMSNESETEF